MGSAIIRTVSFQNQESSSSNNSLENMTSYPRTIGIMVMTFAMVMTRFFLPDAGHAAEDFKLIPNPNYPLLSVERARPADTSEMKVVGKPSDELKTELLSIFSRIPGRVPDKVLELSVVWDDAPMAARISAPGIEVFLVQTQLGWVVSKVRYIRA